MLYVDGIFLDQVRVRDDPNGECMWWNPQDIKRTLDCGIEIEGIIKCPAYRDVPDDVCALSKLGVTISTVHKPSAYESKLAMLWGITVDYDIYGRVHRLYFDNGVPSSGELILSKLSFGVRVDDFLFSMPYDFDCHRGSFTVVFDKEIRTFTCEIASNSRGVSDLMFFKLGTIDARLASYKIQQTAAGFVGSHYNGRNLKLSEQYQHFLCI